MDEFPDCWDCEPSYEELIEKCRVMQDEIARLQQELSTAYELLAELGHDGPLDG